MHTRITDRRLKFFTFLVLLVIFIFIGRLVWFQVIAAPELNRESSQALVKNHDIKAIRGEITDAEGNILASTVLSWDINIDPLNAGPVVLDINGTKTAFTKEQIAQKLADILREPANDILTKMSGTSRYASLKRDVSASTFIQLKQLDIPWVYYDENQSRHYSNGAVAGNLLGFVGSDGTALAGLERTMNSCLAGTDGKETYVQGADWIKIPSSIQTIVPVKDGGDVMMTINQDLQYAAQQEMAATVRRLKADWASAIVIEVKTGRILAAAEAPSVDPNNPGGVGPQNRHSRIFQAAFEPGSILKTVAASTAIDVGKATPQTHVVAPDRLRMPWGQWINDAEIHKPEKLTLAGVLMNSSNTGLVQIGGKVDSATRYEYMKKFGMGVKTGVNFEGESTGLLSNYKSWDKMTDKVVMFGQGVSLTPIQTAMIYQAIANKGVRLSPVLVDGCRDRSGNLTRTSVPGPTRVISESTAKQTIDMLEKVVELGPIGKTARIPGYRIAGKTGTAQIAEGRGYGRLHAVSFVGMAPADDPQYVVAVTAYKSRTVSNSLGATPGFVAIMKQVLKTYKVPPSTTKSADIPVKW
ncbi:MAG: penicillin-binding protein 2 [Micrococcales bacterium]|nr:penicillin-binding protein 2 [Micrococcales bacterium]NBR60334.1 penicillin-binding protein 2 [Actinomycetota bacterium]NBR54397.1 penicillin-binding protein 2 [Micrococcales bacterium]NBT46232.1 penicillin-binding protein 2 [Actinomycetota bacterium]NBY43504.1 penicillin-binding protein 2 [Micrococcales bacterium]